MSRPAQRTTRSQKPPIPSLAPALLRECRMELERQMAVAARGGRPRLLKGRRAGGVLTGAQREKIRQANIARGIERRAAQRALAGDG